MYVSGSLKEKVIETYREKMTFYDRNYLKAGDIQIGFNGEINSLTNYSFNHKLRVRESNIVSKGIKNTYELTRRKAFSTDLIKKEINAIRVASRQINYALFECFYKLIYSATDIVDLKDKIKSFQTFRLKLEEEVRTTPNLSQVDIDIMISLFLEGESYSFESVGARKQELFGLKDTRIVLYNKKTAKLEMAYPLYILKIINLGEFIAPNRVKNVAFNLAQETSWIEFIAPIYFALKSEEKAEEFLDLCSRIDITLKDLIDNATHLQVPENLIHPIRRLLEYKNKR